MKNIMEMPIIRLNGSSYINDMELKERYKVYNDSCWISLLSLVGNPDGAIVTVDEPVSPLLTMDLEKRLKTALEEDPADFLVVDMCYTAGHRLCVWKDQVFTKNPKFEESRFYAEHQDEMEEIDVMRDRNFDWKPYMDRYLELISKYFDKDHIILIKSRCPKWFATHTHVRKVQKKSSKAYNRRIKELEDYFVEKTDPYVIDIYSHYFLDFNHKKGYTMSSYEKPFYHHARRLISYIIRYQPEKRVFTEDEFYIRFGRFIKYYDNLFAKNNTALFMDDSKFIDHLILSLGRPVLVEFEYDIVKIQQEGYASIQEILDKYDFRFSEGLCTCLKVVQAVEEGNLFCKGVRYEAIYEYKMKIVKTYTELVKKELEKRGWLEGPMYINEVHAGTFDAILRALDIFEEEGVPARVLDFPGGMDPDEYIKTYGPQSVEQLRPTDATAYRMKQEAANHDLSTEEGRTAYAIACAKYLAKVKEPVELENYVKQLMVSTGFTREVLLAQIGRTELIEENKRPMFRHAARPLEEKNDGVDTETAAAEKGLLVLLAEGGIEPGTISADDFISPQRRALAQKLLDGLTPAAILEEMDDEEERSRTAKLLSSESGAGEQELRMVADCLRVLEKKRRENEINALKEKMSTQQGEEKRGTLIKIQELLAQENKTGRRE